MLQRSSSARALLRTGCTTPESGPSLACLIIAWLGSELIEDIGALANSARGVWAIHALGRGDS